MMDLTNIAYSDEYISHKNNIINMAYSPNNKTKEKEITGNNLKRIITEYSARHNDMGYFCSNNKVYDMDNTLIFEYFNIYPHNFFCDKIIYKNGKQYVFYKSDLYGYNVFSIDAKETFDYYPGFKGETFIGTDIYFNRNNNIFSVEGCYWACPVDTFLMKIDNPLKQFTKYINTHLMLDGDYDKYDNTDFVGWINNDIKLKCYNIETKEYETIIIKEKEYMERMIKIGK